MSDFKLNNNSMEMYLIRTAIGDNHELIHNMKKNEDGSYPVVFSVGGVELDFSLILEKITDYMIEATTDKIFFLLRERYNILTNILTDINDKIEKMKIALRDYE